MNFKRLTFDNRLGQKLSARLDLPIDSTPIAYALFAHCFTCTKNLKAVGNISRALNQQGIAVLRFDFTGLGESAGDFADTNFSSNIDDLVDAAAFMAKAFEAPKILIGHSLGGAAVLQAASRLENVKAVATIGAPYDPSHVQHLFQSSHEEIQRKGEAVVLLAGRPFTIKKQFIEDLETQRAVENIARLRRALLIMHSPLDKTVDVENARLIYEAAKHPKSYISLDRADHLLSDEADSLYTGSVLAAWVRKYIGTPQEEVKHPDPTDNRIVAHIGQDHYLTEILANGHALLSDEPRAVGGTNAGPTPYDLLVAGLGACTAMTLRMYADHKQWPLETVTVRLLHRKVHVEDCDCETDATGKIDLIERELDVTGALDDAQRQRLAEIADRCPVHRTLEGEIVVKTSLKS